MFAFKDLNSGASSLLEYLRTGLEEKGEISILTEEREKLWKVGPTPGASGGVPSSSPAWATGGEFSSSMNQSCPVFAHLS